MWTIMSLSLCEQLCHCGQYSPDDVTTKSLFNLGTGLNLMLVWVVIGYQNMKLPCINNLHIRSCHLPWPRGYDFYLIRDR